MACPHCGMFPGHIVCQECGVIYYPKHSNKYKCPSCGYPVPKQWLEADFFLLQNVKELPAFDDGADFWYPQKEDDTDKEDENSPIKS